MRSLPSHPHAARGFVAVLVGYASSAAIIWQAAAAAGADCRANSRLDDRPWPGDGRQHAGINAMA